MNTQLRILLLAFGVSVSFAAVSSAAHAGKKSKQVRYVGVHPIQKKHGGGVCYIEAPHVHIYEPANRDTHYRVHDEHYDFVADPVAYGYDGPRQAYYGNHPIEIDLVVNGAAPGHEWCYLDGGHYHEWAPPLGVSYTKHGDAYWYVGETPAVYVSAKPKLSKVNAVYASIDYERPTVYVDAPPVGYVGAFVAVDAPVVEVVAPRVEVVAPVVEVAPVRGTVRAGVDIHIPAPSIEVGIGLPGIYVEDRHRHHNEVVIIGGHGHTKVKSSKKWKGKKKGHRKGH